MRVYAGILAGGSGERLWPLSTSECPKQFLPFINQESLLSLTVNRLASCENLVDELFVVISSSLVPKTKLHLGFKVSFIIEEPVGRNTAPAILLSCVRLHKKDPDSIIAFFPADHFIPEPEGFYKVIRRSIDYVKNHDVIVTLGLEPTYPATGYGYIQADVLHGDGKLFYPATKFHEKPDLKKAKEYFDQRGTYWNAGMFLAKTSVLLREFELYEPDLYKKMFDYISGNCSYDSLQKVSVDYAIMEKSSNIVVSPADFEWHDVGNINIFLQLRNQYGCLFNSKIVNIDAKNNLVCSNKKVIACVGVSNVCVVETENELLIVAKDDAEKVKKVLGFLSKKELEGRVSNYGVKNMQKNF